MRRGALVLFLCFLTVSCSAVKNREKYAEMVSFTRQKQYDEAIKCLNDEDFYDEKSALLKNMDLGNVYYLKGDYYQAIKHFDRAKGISDDLYTVRISGKLASAVSNDNADQYYGEKYEVSMIRFYMALCHYHLSRQGFYEAHKDIRKDDEGNMIVVDVPQRDLSTQERRRHLESARAVIMEWASFMKTTKEEALGKVTYKDDLLNKVYGAMIHEIYGSRQDRQVALNLYKDALDTLFTNYNIYPTYNTRFEAFKKDYDKLPKMPRAAVEAQYVSETEASKTLKAFLNKQIKDLSEKKEGNVKVILKSALIPGKQIEEYKYPIPITAFAFGSTNERAGFMGFLPLMISGSQITFELPKIDPAPPAVPYTLQVVTPEGQEVATDTLVVLSPLSDIAYHAYMEKIDTIKAQTATRLTGKYAVALMAAYVIYQQNDNGTLGLLLALASFKIAEAGIKASERADIRHWGTLAGNVRAASLPLKKGDYVLRVLDQDKVLHEEKITVDGKPQLVDISLIDAN